MKRTLSVFFLIFISIGLSAHGFEPGGVGGGGWLYSGAFAPNSDSTIMFGSDMAGIHIRHNETDPWQPHNLGLPVESGALSSYVQGLLATEFLGTDYYFAATEGGIFGSTNLGVWTLQTSAPDYNYKIINGKKLPIPFSCLATSNGIVVAGAGHSRWELTGSGNIRLNNEPVNAFGKHGLHKLYPNLLAGNLEYSTQAGGQWTVWIKHLDGSIPDWIPYNLDSGGAFQNVFGAARDIAIKEIGGTTYIVVATIDGIYMHNMVAGTPWIDLTEKDAWYLENVLTDPDLVTFGPLRSMGLGDNKQAMRAWNVELTSQGTLYASIERIGSQADNTGKVSGGVYRMHDITALDEGDEGEWKWLGNTDDLPGVEPSWDNMRKLGEADSGDYPLAHQIFMSVVEVDDLGPYHNDPDGEHVSGDVIFVGDRRNRFGLFRGIQAHQEIVDCIWEPLVFVAWDGSEMAPFTIDPTDPDQTRTYLGRGWLNKDGVNVLFKPVVSSDHVVNIDDIKLLLANGAKLHWSPDGGETWVQDYCQEPSGSSDQGPWHSRGFNELAVTELGFMSDTRLVFSSRDARAQMEDSVYKGYYDVLPLETGAGVNAIHTESLTIVPDWNSTGQDAVFVLAGRNKPHQNNKTQIMMHVGGGNPVRVSESIADLDFGLYDESLELFEIKFRDPSTCFVCYRSRYSVEIEVDGVMVTHHYFNCGVLKGEYSQPSGIPAWDWSFLDEGHPPLDPEMRDVNIEQWYQGRELMYHEPSGRMFLGLNQGIFILEEGEVGGWIQVYSATDGPYSDITCLSQFHTGSTLYAGSVGSASRRGTILRCQNPGVIPAMDMVWTPLLNTDETGPSFPIIQPYFEDNIANPSASMTQINSICVDRFHPSRFYFSVRFGYFHPKQGLWSYNYSGLNQINHLSEGTALHGADISHMVFDKYISSQLVLGTNGLGIYNYDTSQNPGYPMPVISTQAEDCLFHGYDVASVFAVEVLGADVINYNISLDATNIGVLDAIDLKDDGSYPDVAEGDHIFTGELPVDIPPPARVASVVVNIFEGQTFVSQGTVQVEIFDLPLVEFVEETAATQLMYEGQPYSCVTLDFDGVAPKDMFISLEGSAGALFVANSFEGDIPKFERVDFGSFGESDPPTTLLGLAVADFDNDDLQDIFCASQDSPKLYKCVDDPGGQYSYKFESYEIPAGVALKSVAVSWGDYDLDGFVDLAIGRADCSNASAGSMGALSLPDVLLRNETGKGGGFLDVSDAVGITPGHDTNCITTSWCDVDSDGYPDLFFGDTQETNKDFDIYYISNLFMNQKGKTFTEEFQSRSHHLLGFHVSGIQWADINNDGNFDMVLSSQATASRVCLNSGEGVFSIMDTHVFPFNGSTLTAGLQVFDYDLDGRQDVLIVERGEGGKPVLWENTTSDIAGTKFHDVSTVVGLDAIGDIGGVIAADFKGDGDFDIFLGRKDEDPNMGGLQADAFFQATQMSDGPIGPDEPVNNWVALDLISPDGVNNKMAIGAVARLYVDGMTEPVSIQQVDGGSSRGGQADHTLIFGLGNYSVMDRITVTWPNGHVQDFTGMQPNSKILATDQSTLSIIPGSYYGSYTVIPNSPLANFIFSWDTNIATPYWKDEVTIFAGSCQDDEVILTYDSAGVDLAISKNPDGSFHHELIWNNQLCIPNCIVDYKVKSAAGEFQGANALEAESPARYFSMSVCGQKINLFD